MTLKGAKAYIKDKFGDDDTIVFNTSSTLYEFEKDLLEYMKTVFFNWYCENANEFTENLYDSKKYVSDDNVEWGDDDEGDVHGRTILDVYDIESCKHAYIDHMGNVENLKKFEQILDNEGITLEVIDYCIYTPEDNNK